MHHASANVDHVLVLLLKYLVRTVSITGDVSLKILIKLPQMVRATGEFIAKEDDGMGGQQFARDMDPHIM